jgi:hypothetical protein
MNIVIKAVTAIREQYDVINLERITGTCHI